MVVQNIIFFCISAMICASAIGVVRTKNVVHAALFLVTVLAGVAGLFLLIAAEFLAWVQVLIYIGAVTVLLLFGIMLTKAPMGKSEDLDNDSKLPAYAVALGTLVLLIALIVDAFDSSQKIAIGGKEATKTLANGRMDALGDSILYTYVFPFEVVGLLLLAALIGAVVMARKD